MYVRDFKGNDLRFLSYDHGEVFHQRFYPGFHDLFPLLIYYQLPNNLRGSGDLGSPSPTADASRTVRKESSLLPAPHPLPMDFSSTEHLVAHPAPAANGSLRQQRQAVADGRGSDSDRNDEDEERQYLKHAPLPLWSRRYNKRYFYGQEPSVCRTIGK